MKRFVVLSVAALAVFAGCSTDPDDCLDPGVKSGPYIGEPMFERCAGMDITIDRPAYSVGDSLTLTTSFEPLYTGVAELSIWFLPLESRSDHVGVLVTAPLLVSTGGALYSGPVTIGTTGRVAMPVSFVVRDNTSYHITAAIHFLQVGDPATGELLDMHSDEQIASLGRLDHTAYGTSTPFVLSRPLP